MDFEFAPEQKQICLTIQEICSDYSNKYLRELDVSRSNPDEFVDELIEGEAGCIDS